MRIEQAVVRTVVANKVRFERTTGVLLLLARRVEGDVRVLLDWRGALAFGAAFGVVVVDLPAPEVGPTTAMQPGGPWRAATDASAILDHRPAPLARPLVRHDPVPLRGAHRAVIDPSARVHATADLEADVSVGAGTSIWHRAQVRTGATIGAECVIGRDVFIDEGVVDRRPGQDPERARSSTTASPSRTASSSGPARS